MKTKLFFPLLSVIIFTLFLISGCNKERDENNSASLRQLSKDELTIQSALDEAVSDVNDVLSKGTSKDLMSLPCNSSLDSTVVNDTIVYTLTFDGLNCAGTKIRVGTVVIKKQVNTHWADINATVKVMLQNLKITRVSTNESVILNGTKTFVNVSGGLFSQLSNGELSSVVHKITGTVNATFDDNTTRTWNIARQRTITYVNGKFVFTHIGFGNAGGYDNLVVWGTNRNGELFYTQILQEVVFKQACNWNPCSGIKKHNVPSNDKEATVTFGFNSNNEPVGDSDCPTHYKVDWKKNNHTGTFYLPL